MSLPYEKELRRALTFERLFRLPVWYAYKGKMDGTWYWISALKAIEVGKLREHKESKVPFLSIRLEEFELVSSNADFGKLYTHRLPGLKKIKVGKEDDSSRGKKQVLK